MFANHILDKELISRTYIKTKIGAKNLSRQFSKDDIFRWPINTRKDTEHHKSLGKYKPNHVIPSYYPRGGPPSNSINTCSAKIHPPLEARPQLLLWNCFFWGKNRCSEGLWFIKVADQFKYSTANLFFQRMLFSLPVAQLCPHVCAPCRTSLRSTDVCPEGWPSVLLFKAALRFSTTGILFVVLLGTNALFPKVSRTHSTHRAGPRAALCSLEENPQMLTHWFPLMRSRGQSQVCVSANVRKAPLGLQCIFQCSVWIRNINRTFKMLLLGYF